MKTKCLFGGALLGAGVCAGAGSSAHAGNFVWGSGFAYGYLAYTNLADQSTIGGDFGLTVTDAYGGSASAAFDAHGFSVSATAGNYSVYTFATMNTEAFFTVDENMAVRFDWDLSANSPYTSQNDNFLQVFNSTTMSFENIFSFSLPDSGSFSLTLEAGNQYYIKSYISSTFDGQSSSFSVSVVPLPPAAFAGLGMLAGLGAYKRIRRR